MKKIFTAKRKIFEKNRTTCQLDNPESFMLLKAQGNISGSNYRLISDNLKFWSDRNN